MFAVIFEVQPRPERWDDYLAVAKTLRPALERIDGFIDNERFTSTRQKGRLLSLSIWRDEKAVIRWRTLAIHRDAQERGRSEIFADYHLRVGEITADTDCPVGRVLPEQRLDETEIGTAKCCTISELLPQGGESPAPEALAQRLGAPAIGVAGLVDSEAFDSITTSGKGRTSIFGMRGSF